MCGLGADREQDTMNKLGHCISHSIEKEDSNHAESKLKRKKMKMMKQEKRKRKKDR